MRKRIRKTSINGQVNVPDNGQYKKSNYFCINCHAIGTNEVHYGECTEKESYSIVTSAEVPKKNANKRAWKLFKEKYLFSKPLGYWTGYSYSWWNKHKS